MILSLNGIQINRCNIVNFMPRESSEAFTMLAGNTRWDIIAQFDWPLQISYDLIKSDDYEVAYQVWKTAAAIAVSFTDWKGRLVSFQGKMSPPQFTMRRILKDGQWLIGQCTFTLDEM